MERPAEPCQIFFPPWNISHALCETEIQIAVPAFHGFEIDDGGHRRPLLNQCRKGVAFASECIEDHALWLSRRLQVKNDAQE